MAVQITEAAKARVRELIVEHDDGRHWLRLAVRGGGCTGLMYHMDWVETPSMRSAVAAARA